MTQTGTRSQLPLSALRALMGSLIAVLLIGGPTWGMFLQSRDVTTPRWSIATVILIPVAAVLQFSLPVGRRQLRGRQQWLLPRLRLPAALTYQSRVLLAVGVVPVGVLGLLVYGTAARHDVSLWVMTAGMMLFPCWPTRSRILDFDAAMHGAGHESNAYEQYYGEPDLDELVPASSAADAGTQH